MTFSVLKSTPSNELSSPTNSVKGEGQSDGSISGEEKSSNIFSELFSAFTGEKKSEGKVEGKDSEESLDSALDTSKTKLGEELTEGIALDSELTESLVDDAEISALAPAEIKANEKALESGDVVSDSESSDDLLARLGKSEKLLQGEPQGAVTAEGDTAQVKPDGNVNNVMPQSGNGLPLTAINNGASTESIADPSMVVDEIASLNSTAMNLTPAQIQASGVQSDKQANGSTKKLTDVLNALSTEKNENISDVVATDGVMPINALASANIIADAPVKDQAMSQFMNMDSAEGKQGESGNDKRFNPAAANVASAANAITTAMAGNNSGSGFDLNTPAANDLEQMDSLTTDSSEQADFNQTLETVRRQEQADSTSRAQAKASVLTEAEQQILDKRVNINSASASSELNEKIAIMAGKELQTATIRLDPSEMGSMNIKLSMQNDQATVVIHAQNAQSRELLEQQLPRLREMLQQQGIALGDTQVQADSGGQQSAFQQNDEGNRAQSGEKASNNTTNYAADSQTETAVSSEYWQDSGKGVDFYA